MVEQSENLRVSGLANLIKTHRHHNVVKQCCPQVILCGCGKSHKHTIFTNGKKKNHNHRTKWAISHSYVKYPDGKSLFDGRMESQMVNAIHFTKKIFLFNTQMVNGKSYYMNYPNFI
jgi:CDGSH-type Zn-finger protein